MHVWLLWLTNFISTYILLTNPWTQDNNMHGLPSTNWSPMSTRKATVNPKVYRAMHSRDTIPSVCPHISLTTPSNDAADVMSTNFARDIKLPTANATSIYVEWRKILTYKFPCTKLKYFRCKQYLLLQLSNLSETFSLTHFCTIYCSSGGEKWLN